VLLAYTRLNDEDLSENTHNFRHVENDNGRLETDSDTSNETTNDDSSKGVTSTSDHLDDDTDGIDDTASNDSPFTSNAIGNITSDDGTEESTGRQDRDDERSVG